MKLTALLLIISVHVSALGFGQGKMTLSLQDVRLKYAIGYIQRISPYRFIYSDDLFPAATTVSVTVQDATIGEVMDLMLRSTGLRYRFMNDNLIVLSPAAQPATFDFPVHGTVTLHNAENSSAGSRAGVSVVEKGTSNGTTTGETGEFSLTVHDGNAVVVVSSVGYETKEVPVEGHAELAVTLEASSRQLQDVVVTALGITRQKKSITYATQSLKGSDLADTREVNVTGAMNGKVAGMTISKTNAGPGSSTRIIFRGNRSITSNNQPLLIVDGVRIDNTTHALADVSYNVAHSRDEGDGIGNINPDDIESMTVLTGASAAALYGSDAANGAVIITTKKGRSGRGTGVSYAGSLMLENPMIGPKFQNAYGQGTGGNFDPKALDSWGPKMSGQSETDWTGKSQPLSPQPDNFRDFFNTGSEWLNSVSLSAGGDKSQTYFSYTNTYSKGILPNNYFRRHNLNLRETVNFTPKLSLDLKANYIVEDVENRPMSGGGNLAMTTLYTMPRSLRTKDMENYEYVDLSDFSLKQNFWGTQNPGVQNPYWSVYRNLYDRPRNRFIGLAALKYQITPALSIQGRSSIDYYADKSEEKDYSDSYWIDYAGGGNYIYAFATTRQFNNDVLATYTTRFGDVLSLTVNAGASIEQYNYEGIRSNDQGLLVANQFSLGNALAITSTNSVNRTEKHSVYASASLGYRNWLYLDLTGRNDWNSTLPAANNSYFFPSAGLSALLNQALHMSDDVSLLKLRGSYAFVANGTTFNQFKSSPYIGPGGNGGFLFLDNTLRNPDLKPEETRSVEAGLDLGLFGNRVGFEFTVYNTNTKNQILSIGVPSPSGYSFRVINAGEIRNRGIEWLLHGSPVAGRDFRWDMALNFGLNRNKILYLDSVQKAPPLASPETLGTIVAEEGKAFGGIYTTSFVRNDAGQIVVDDNGLPEQEGDQTKHFAGNYNPDWTAGLTNTFSYRNWSVSFLIDMRKGGIVVSGSQALMATRGVTQNTLAGREGGFVVPNSVHEDGSKNDKVVSAEDYWRAVGSDRLIGELFVNSATNIRLRQATLTYTLPAKWTSGKTVHGASFSLVGRNLFFFRNDAVGFDPESALGTGNNQGLEYTPVPSTRSYGLYLKLNF